MWYVTKAIQPLGLGKRRKGVKVGDTLYWTPSAVSGKVIVFNGDKAWETVDASTAARYLGDLSNPAPAQNWSKVAEDYMTVSVR